MASWAKPGVKCVCIDADPIQGTAWNHGDEVIEGATYTIRKVWIDVKGALVMDFVEKVRSPLSAFELGLPRVGYAVWRFRPLVTKTQEEDVAMFKRIADDVPMLEPIA